jgi:2,3-bisphosphoglycerate-dependent phosphoglycerate mutase
MTDSTLPDSILGVPPKPQLFTEFWVIRHGETLWNATGQLQGHADIELSDGGLEQCARLERRLEGLCFAAVYASDLLRAKHTAEIIVQNTDCPDKSVRLEPRLREIDVGLLSSLHYRDIPTLFPEYVLDLQRDAWQTRRPGGESMADLYARVQNCLLELSVRHAGERVLIVTHGGVVRVAVALALGGLQDVWARLSIENTSITRILLNTHGGKLISYNDAAHLERAKPTPDDADDSLE